MPAPDERKFKVFRRGQVRDTILTSWRNSLRNLINPTTGVAFTEDEIQRATQGGSRFYIEADALDLVSQANQQRALFLADQTDPRKANSEFLKRQHGEIWLGTSSLLPAVGSSGFISAQATPGSVFVGSATIPDPTAGVLTDPSGNRYQVVQTLVVPGTVGGSLVAVRLQVRALSTGAPTNIASGTVLKWSANAPLSAAPTAAVVSLDPSNPLEGLSGGFDIETEAQYAVRVEDRIRRRPASGNPAHFLAWARQATVAVESAFVYCTALNAGSVVVAILEKRSTERLEGPNARKPAIGTLTDVRNYIVPPNSPVMPNRAFVLVTGWNEQPSDLSLSIAMARGATGGWGDVDPWPRPSLLNPVHEIATTNGTDTFTFPVDVPLVGGAASLSGDEAPRLMLWDALTSRFVELDVASVTIAANVATVALNSQPDSPEPTAGALTLLPGMRVSPATDRLTTIAEALEAYFDSIGPGELVNLQVSALGARSFRVPTPADSYPQRAGQAMVPFLVEALGGVAATANLDSISREVPDLPGSISDGPNMVTLGKVSVYPL